MPTDAPTPSRGFLKRLLADRKGVIAMVAAIAFPILITIAGFGTEVALWYSAKRQMQGVADAAAYAAALGMQAGESATAYKSEATGIAGYNGFVTGTNSVTVTVKNPPTMGNYTSNNNAVEVIIQQPVSQTLTAALGTTSVTLAARAVAKPAPSAQTCVLSLSTIAVSGNGSLSTTSASAAGYNCTVAADSTAAGAISAVGNGSIAAAAIEVESPGTGTTGGNGTISPAPTQSPYIAVPTQVTGVSGGVPSGCVAAPPATTMSIPAGCYTGISLAGNDAYTLQSGTYWIVNSGATQSSFAIAGNASATGAGAVTIFLTSTNAAACPSTLSIGGNASMSISAPTSGAYQGVAVYQYPGASTSANCSTTSSSSVAGNGGFNVNGLIYLPDSTLSIAGNGITSNGHCAILIAASISVSGNGGLSNQNCSLTYGGATVFQNIYSNVVLVE